MTVWDVKAKWGAGRRSERRPEKSLSKIKKNVRGTMRGMLDHQNYFPSIFTYFFEISICEIILAFVEI